MMILILNKKCLSFFIIFKIRVVASPNIMTDFCIHPDVKNLLKKDEIIIIVIII